MKKYDTFIFNNELDLLEIRLNILNDYVDYFVIVEANETFSGFNKPLYFKNNKEKFKKFENKIIHYVVDNNDSELWEYSKSSPNVGVGDHWWVREFYQKENILKAFEAKNDDMVFVSDVDEIWNPKVIFKENGIYKKNEIYRPIQTAYHYYLNNKSDQDITGWVGTRFGSYKSLKTHKVNHFRTEHYAPSIQIPNGGWHFTNIGDKNFIQSKIESYGHQEYNNEFIKDRIRDCMINNVDFLGRGFKLWKDQSELPEYILNNKEKYKHLFKND
jgi:beta-1,4-mannosyl-glycoprotein beta-1,4-N-acetylglucosaminyltransferase